MLDPKIDHTHHSIIIWLSRWNCMSIFWI